MKLNVSKELIEANKNNSIDFKSIYGEDFKIWSNELSLKISLGKDDELVKLLGFLYPYLCEKCDNEAQENNKLLEKLGLDKDNKKQLFEFAVAMIIEDSSMKFQNDVLVTEMLQPQNIVFED